LTADQKQIDQNEIEATRKKKEKKDEKD